MTQQFPTDHDLMAYADGELDARARRQIAEMIAEDPVIAERVKMFSATRELVKAAAGAQTADAVPDRLRASIEQMINRQDRSNDDTVVAFRPKAAPLPERWHWAKGLAASIGILVAGLGGYILKSSQDSGSGNTLLAVGSEAPSQIADILNKTPSGGEVAIGDTKVRLIATVRDAENRLCRELETNNGSRASLVAVACRHDKGWAVTMAVVAVPSDTGFAPASSLDSVEAYLSAIGAEAHLTIEQEKSALAEIK